MSKHHGKARAVKDGAHRGARRPYHRGTAQDFADNVLASHVAARILSSDATAKWAEFVRSVLAVADLPPDVAAATMELVAEGMAQEGCVR